MHADIGIERDGDFVGLVRLPGISHGVVLFTPHAGGLASCLARFHRMRPRTMKKTPRPSKKMLERLKSPRKTDPPKTNPIAISTAPQKMSRTMLSSLEYGRS